jgi:hypothetical protein
MPNNDCRRAGSALVPVVAVLSLAALLSACGSSSKAAANAQSKGTCKRVEAALSDGPEPEADPVGYAQAQVLPLREIHTADAGLANAISGLASAYQRFAYSKGSSSAKAAVNTATQRIKVLCPGIEL